VVAVNGNTVTARLKARRGGRAWLFAWNGERTVGFAEARLKPKRRKTVTLEIAQADMAALLSEGHILVSFRDRPKAGIGTRSVAVPLSG
jgi:hypothetical protein